MDPRELVLRKTIPVVVNSYNQPTYLKQLLSLLDGEGFRNLYVLDQGSTSPELINYYKDGLPIYCTVFYLGKNFGPHFFYLNKFYDLFEGGAVVYTDPDVSFEKLHPNFLSSLFDISNKYSEFKVGCALEIPPPDKMADLKYTEAGRQFSIAEWESQWWEKKKEPNVYDAAVDTTLHLFQPKYFNQGTHISGLRVSGDGFTIKHMPWYKQNGVPQAELDFYVSHSTHSTWKII
jgi:hypothetical protein